jgi:hypothetical protein
MRHYMLHKTIVSFSRSYSKFLRPKQSFTYYLSSVILICFPNMHLPFDPKCKISWKTVPWEPSCYMRTDRETERRNMTKLIVAFRNFTILPKNGHQPCHSSSIYSPICHRKGQHVTANARAQSQAIVREVWMKEFDNSSGTLLFPCQYYSVFAPCSFIHHRRHVTVSNQTVGTWHT